MLTLAQIESIAQQLKEPIRFVGMSGIDYSPPFFVGNFDTLEKALDKLSIFEKDPEAAWVECRIGNHVRILLDCEFNKRDPDDVIKAFLEE